MDKFKCFIVNNKIKVILFIIICVICCEILKYIPDDLTISFIDVGQGDCTLITTPNNKNILIDGGGSKDLKKYDVGKKVLLPYLLNHGIKKIDMMIISHFDSDHCNGLIAILENLKVNKIIIGKQKEKSYECENIINIAKDRKIIVKSVKSQEKIIVDENTYFDVIYPKDKLEEDGLNNNSLVLKLNYNNFSMLFTGDIQSQTEERIIDIYKKSNKLKSTVLKVAHHGSKTSSTKEFLELIKPQIALIGVGKNNNFGHPNKEVLQRLSNIGIKTYRTDLNGEIILKINKDGEVRINTIL